MDLFTQNPFAGAIAASILAVLAVCLVAIWVYRRHEVQNTIAAVGLVLVLGLGIIGAIGQFAH